MQNDISVAALCLNLEQKLMEVWNNELTLERYRKVLAEFTVFAGNSSYSQSLGADFLIARFTERGGLVSTDEHSRKEETYLSMVISFEMKNETTVTFQKTGGGRIKKSNM